LYSRFEQILKIKVLHPLKNHSKKNWSIREMILGMSAFVYRVMVGGNPDKFGRNGIA
jgi:hypothetical protein